VSALGRVVRAGVGRRRVQTFVMALTTLLAVTASVMALGLLVASEEPFDRGFAAQRGAHLTAQFDGGKVSAERLEATAQADGVAAAAGPFPTASLRLIPESVPGAPPPGYAVTPLTVAGRAEAAPGVDNVGLVEGRWVSGPGEIVIEAGARTPAMTVGSRLKAEGEHGWTEFTVVGIAESVGESADAWVVPAQLDKLAAGGSGPAYQMLYRLTDAGTRADVAAGRDAIASAVPARALSGTQSYLDIKQISDQATGAYIPFLNAFALLGLAMSMLVIGIVVSGAVSSATRRIGVLKALGFTPRQVGNAYVAQALLPATIGAAAGVLAGNLLAAPLLSRVAEAFGTERVAIPLWVDVAVPAGALVLVAATALGPALRAARLRSAEVIAVGRSPRAGRGRRVRRLLGRLPLPRAVSLGLAGPFARPARSATMAAAITFGALGVTFAVGLGTSLIAIQTDGDPDARGDVVVRMAPPEFGATPPGGPAESADPGAFAAAIREQPGTASYYGVAGTDVTVAGVKGAVPLVAYEGEASPDSHTMVSGRWFGARGEAVAPSRFLRATGTRIGDTVTLTDQGRTVRLTIVGEVFDLNEDGMTLRTGLGSVAALVPDLAASEYNVELEPGTDTARYIEDLNAALRPAGGEATTGEGGESSVILIMQGLIALLTAMLVAVACLGVLNTVVLDTRERVHDLGVYKALGMSPRQTSVMVLTSVAGIGLAAGAVGVPLGVALHHYVLPEMGEAVGTTIPGVDIEVYGPYHLVLLALGGVAIAALGALLPAGWAARTSTARALRTE
jgi:putative ABC transport system permease protein